MYLKHFALKKMPFALTPNTEFSCNFSSHQEALNVLLYGLHSGEGIIKIIGEVGSGKTFLCRELLNCLDPRFIVVYIPNPSLSPQELREAILRELGCETTREIDVMKLVLDKIFRAHQNGKRVVIIVDEAQSLPDESLEALRLLTNLETESEKLLQIVLFAQPELDERLKQHAFRQLSQRIAFSYIFTALVLEETEEYISQRLIVAGHKTGRLFDRKSIKLLHRASCGTPRIINILCHKALLFSYGRGEHKVELTAVKRAIEDSADIVAKNFFRWKLKI